MASASGANVIDLDEFRRRRAAPARTPRAPMLALAWMPAPAFGVFYPVWCWVPVASP